MTLPRPCERCEVRFLPDGTDCKICNKCLRKSQIKSAQGRMEKYYTKIK